MLDVTRVVTNNVAQATCNPSHAMIMTLLHVRQPIQRVRQPSSNVSPTNNVYQVARSVIEYQTVETGPMKATMHVVSETRQVYTSKSLSHSAAKPLANLATRTPGY